MHSFVKSKYSRTLGGCFHRKAPLSTPLVRVPLYRTAVGSRVQTFPIENPGSDFMVTRQDTGFQVIGGDDIVCPTIRPNGMKKYEITFRTGRASGAGTDADIDIKLVNNPEQEVHQRNHWKSFVKYFRVNKHLSGNAFESGDVDRHTFTKKDIGLIDQIYVKSKDNYAGSDWQLAGMTVKYQHNGADYVFDYKAYSKHNGKYREGVWITDTKEKVIGYHGNLAQQVAHYSMKNGECKMVFKSSPCISLNGCVVQWCTVDQLNAGIQTVESSVALIARQQAEERQGTSGTTEQAGAAERRMRELKKRERRKRQCWARFRNEPGVVIPDH